MTKRRANDDLNKFNWDRDDRDDVEEAERNANSAEFKKASDDILSRRVIRKARRSLPERDEGQEEPKLSLFSGFQGFKKPDASQTATSSSNGGGGAGVASFNFLEKFNGGMQKQEESVTKRARTDDEQAVTKPDRSTRLIKIRGLNESVSRWITDHVRTNPLCDLTPIFDDYRKYMTEIEAGENEKKAGPVSVASSGPEPVKPLFTFPTMQPATVAAAAAPATSPPSKFSFNLTGSSPLSSSSLSSSPFTFNRQTNGDAAPAAQTADGQQNENDEDDNQPPPVEDSFDDIKEEGAVFSIKCKVFFMENGAFVDKGVCYAFLKPVNTKLQLIARLNNKLGTIVVNTLLTKTIATQIKKRNEKNVLITCVPNAAQAQNPLPVLFKVKSATDADRFIEHLNDNLN